MTASLAIGLAGICWELVFLDRHLDGERADVEALGGIDPAVLEIAIGILRDGAQREAIEDAADIDVEILIALASETRPPLVAML